LIPSNQTSAFAGTRRVTWAEALSRAASRAGLAGAAGAVGDSRPATALIAT
jgi:hypothetical protein